MAYKIIIAGAGGIGKAVGLILAEERSFDCHLIYGDISDQALAATKQFVSEGLSEGNNVGIDTFLMPRDGSDAAMDAHFESADVILDCLPGSQAPRMARMAKKYNLHYANLTEYVNETNQIKEIADGADTAFVLQTGLAPGFINVLACKLFQKFQAEYKVDHADSIEMKVGALSQHAKAPHYYAFTWSPIGVATEYLKDAEIVRDHKKINVPALSGTELLIIDGENYEDNFTSGGAADLPDAFAGKVKDLDYKTLRFPGHYAWVNSIIETCPSGEDKIQFLEKTMLDAIPNVEDDVVIVYASVMGKDHAGRLRKIEKSYKILPSQVGKKTLRAIQTTTAAPLCEITRMMVEKDWKGLKLQSELPTDEFLNGPFVSHVYGKF